MKSSTKYDLDLDFWPWQVSQRSKFLKPQLWKTCQNMLGYYAYGIIYYWRRFAIYDHGVSSFRCFRLLQAPPREASKPIGFTCFFLKLHNANEGVYCWFIRSEVNFELICERKYSISLQYQVFINLLHFKWTPIHYHWVKVTENFNINQENQNTQSLYI